MMTMTMIAMMIAIGPQGKCEVRWHNSGASSGVGSAILGEFFLLLEEQMDPRGKAG